MVIADTTVSTKAFSSSCLLPCQSWPFLMPFQVPFINLSFIDPFTLAPFTLLSFPFSLELLSFTNIPCHFSTLLWGTLKMMERYRSCSGADGIWASEAPDNSCKMWDSGCSGMIMGTGACRWASSLLIRGINLLKISLLQHCNTTTGEARGRSRRSKSKYKKNVRNKEKSRGFMLPQSQLE